MKRIKKILLYYLLILFAWQVSAQDVPGVSTAVDTTLIRPGEQIRLQVTAQTDTLSFVDFPELSALGDMEVVKTSPVDTLQAKPVRRLQKKYFITAWDSGQYVVPPLNIKINDSTFVTDTLKVQVKPVAVDTTKQGLYGFKEPVNIEGKALSELPAEHSYLWWLLGLLALAGAGYYFYRRRQKIIAGRHIVTPYERAMQNLEKLSKEKLWLQNQVDLHYLQLTDTLKDYLENELHLPAKEKISSELLQSLKKYRFENGSYFSPELLQRLKETLQRADLAKFAKLTPNPADIDLDFNVIKDVIDYAHGIVQEIADAKASELAAIQEAKKRKKRIALITASAIVLVIAIVGGAGYYYLNKMKLVDTIQENMKAPEWVYNEYGSDPALAVTTPHILHSLDISQSLDSLPPNVKKLIDEAAFYQEQNLIKKYFLLAGSMDFTQKIPDNAKITEGIMYGILQQIKARNINLQQADLEDGAKRYFGDFTIDVPVVGKNLKVQFDSRFFTNESGVKMLLGMYLQGNKDNEALIERVMQSAELVK